MADASATPTTTPNRMAVEYEAQEAYRKAAADLQTMENDVLAYKANIRQMKDKLAEKKAHVGFQRAYVKKLKQAYTTAKDAAK